MPRKPNLLFIFTDEQRADTLACYGNTFVRAPHLNSLAEQSIVFENAYVTQTICTPSRSSIMTGQYPHTNGCMNNGNRLGADTRTIAQMIDGDYAKAYCGKWHLGDEIFPQHGFETWIGVEDFYRSDYSRPEMLEQLSPYHHYLESQGFKPNVEDHGKMLFGRTMSAMLPRQHTKPMFQARKACEFFEQNKDRPFAMYVNFLEPHMPFQSLNNAMYDPKALPVGPAFRKLVDESASQLNYQLSQGWSQTQRWEAGDCRTEEGCRDIMARYWGLVSLVDDAVGAILAGLEASGLADNTIVVFTSDHGEMLGDHYQFTKSCQYEQVMRVPLLMRVPWLGKQGRRAAGRISQVDLVPTLLDLMGQAPCADVDGKSRAGVVRGDSTLRDNDVFVEWTGRGGRAPLRGQTGDFASGPWRTVISHEGWKLNLSPVDQCELYDLNTDPCEMTNLYQRGEHRSRIADLAGRIRQWQQQTKDTCALPAV